MQSIYLFTPGESRSTVQTRHREGRVGSTELTPRGQRHARVLGEYLLDRGIYLDIVQSAPEPHTLDTARLAVGNDRRVFVDNRLKEVPYGSLDELGDQYLEHLYSLTGLPDEVVVGIFGHERGILSLASRLERHSPEWANLARLGNCSLSEFLWDGDQFSIGSLELGDDEPL